MTGGPPVLSPTQLSPPGVCGVLTLPLLAVWAVPAALWPARLACCTAAAACCAAAAAALWSCCRVPGVHTLQLESLARKAARRQGFTAVPVILRQAGAETRCTAQTRWGQRLSTPGDGGSRNHHPLPARRSPPSAQPQLLLLWLSGPAGPHLGASLSCLSLRCLALLRCAWAGRQPGSAPAACMLLLQAPCAWSWSRGRPAGRCSRRRARATSGLLQPDRAPGAEQGLWATRMACGAQRLSLCR